MLTRELPLEKLTSKYIYTLKITKIKEPPSSQETIMEKIHENELNWNLIYTSGRFCSSDVYTRSFYFKCAHNILYLNERLFEFKEAPSQMCSFCKSEKENILHLFYKCSIKNLWCKLNDKLTLQLPPLSPKTVWASLGLKTSLNTILFGAKSWGGGHLVTPIGSCRVS